MADAALETRAAVHPKLLLMINGVIKRKCCGRERGVKPYAWGLPTTRQGCVANLAQGVVQRRLPLPVWGLDGYGVELCSRRKTLVALLDHQLPFLDHV